MYAVTIDISGPQGNAVALMAEVRRWGRELGVDTAGVLEEMMSGDYEHLLRAMAHWAHKQGIELTLTNQRAWDEIKRKRRELDETETETKENRTMYAVTVKEINTYVYHVEADSPEEAEEIARERRECSYDDGEEGLEEIGAEIHSTDVRELDEEEMDA